MSRNSKAKLAVALSAAAIAAILLYAAESGKQAANLPQKVSVSSCLLCG